MQMVLDQTNPHHVEHLTQVPKKIMFLIKMASENFCDKFYEDHRPSLIIMMTWLNSLLGQKTPLHVKNFIKIPIFLKNDSSYQKDVRKVFALNFVRNKILQLSS